MPYCGFGHMIMQPWRKATAYAGIGHAGCVTWDAAGWGTNEHTSATTGRMQYYQPAHAILMRKLGGVLQALGRRVWALDDGRIRIGQEEVMD